MNFPYQLLNGRHQVQKFKSVDSGSKMTHLPYFEHKRCTNSPEFPHPVLHFGLNKKFPQKNVLIEPLLHVKKKLKKVMSQSQENRVSADGQTKGWTELNSLAPPAESK